jgi:hypothetical protein
MFHTLLNTLLLIATTCLHAASSSDTHVTKFPKVLAIPGLNGWGSSKEYLAKATGARETDIINVSTPHYFPDLGQGHCQRNLDKAIATLSADDKYILIGSSQGSGTALNHKGNSQLLAIVSDSCMASGNSAIGYHVAEKDNLLCSLLFPYLARFKFPLYRPSGMQAIKSIATINPDTLVILLHATRDPGLSYSDALALYYGLRSRGHNNTYLITVDDQKHTGLLNAGGNATRKILMHHNLVPADASADQESGAPIDLRLYQPDYQAFQKHYQRALLVEKIHKYTDIPVTLTMLYTILWFFGITQALGLPL